MCFLLKLKKGFSQYLFALCFIFSYVDALITEIMMHCHDFYGYWKNLFLAYHKVEIANVKRMH